MKKLITTALLAAGVACVAECGVKYDQPVSILDTEDFYFYEYDELGDETPWGASEQPDPNGFVVSSGKLDAGKWAALGIEVGGPGTLSFKWKMSNTSAGSEYFSICADGIYLNVNGGNGYTYGKTYEESIVLRGPDDDGHYIEWIVENVDDEKAVEKLRRIVIHSAQLAERRQGSLPAHVSAVVEKLRKPELNWKELLKQFVTSCYCGSRRWLPPARRYVGIGLYLQSRRSERLEAVLAVDTSGSTMGDLPQFFAELSNLLDSFGNYELTVIHCDCEVRHVEKFSDAKPLPRNHKWQSFGNGGTSFAPPFEYVEKHGIRPQVFIYLTDGCGDAPEKPPAFPVLWVLTRDGEVPAKWGRCIRLKHGANDGA